MHKELFQWGNDFNTGNSTIDSQHHHLVTMINDLLQLSISNKYIETDVLEKAGKDLSAYVVEHFSTEEKLMETYQVDSRHRDQHLEYHHTFVGDIQDHFSDVTKLQDPIVLNELVEYLIRWLAYHILNTDRSLVQQLSHIQEAHLSPEEAFNKEYTINQNTTEPLLKALKVLYNIVVNKNKEIAEKNVELEKKVALRTAELTEANQRLNEMVFQDVLTHLPNRKYMMEELERLRHLWERYETPFSILFMDLDHFKSVNDHYGHDHGDEVLIWVADFLKSHVRKTDIVCRQGGDEFVIICPQTASEGAMALGKNLNDYCKGDKIEKLDYWEPSISIGISQISPEFKSTDDLLKQADSAMYRSKTSGGNSTSL